MSTRHWHVAVAAACLSTTAISPASAQMIADVAGAGEQCVTLEQALTLGARLGPDVATARARLDGAEASLTEARSLFRPQLSAFVRTGIGDAGLTDSRIENQIGVRVSQRLLDFGASHYARVAARANVQARQADVAAAEAEAAETIGLAYLGWLETRDRLTATQDRERFFQRQQASTAALLDTGGATVADIADVEAQLLDAQSARIELQFLLERYATLLEIGTRRADSPCDVASTSSELAELTPNVPDVQAFVAASPAIIALRRTVDGLAATAAREDRSRFPVIGITGISSYATEEFNSAGDLRNRVGIDVSVPLYSGRAQSARIRGAVARTNEAEGELGQALRQLEEEVSIGLRRIAALGNLLARRDEAARNRQSELRAAETQFQRGLRTLPELIEVRINLEQAELAAISTRYELARQRLRLRTIAGISAALTP